MGPARPHTDPIAHTTPQCQTNEYLLHVCYGGLTYAHSFRSAELPKGYACVSWRRALLPTTTIGTRRRNSITTTTTTTNKQRFTGPKGRAALSCLFLRVSFFVSSAHSCSVVLRCFRTLSSLLTAFTDCLERIPRYCVCYMCIN